MAGHTGSPTVVGVRDVPWWGVISSAATPVLLIGGWMVAPGLQPQPFDSVRQSVSALAAPGTAHRGVMSLVFLVVAACYITTALAVRPAGNARRLGLVASARAGGRRAGKPPTS